MQEEVIWRAKAQREIAKQARVMLNCEKYAEWPVKDWIKELLSKGLLDDPPGRIS